MTKQKNKIPKSVTKVDHLRVIKKIRPGAVPFLRKIRPLDNPDARTSIWLQQEFIWCEQNPGEAYWSSLCADLKRKGL